MTIDRVAVIGAGATGCALLPLLATLPVNILLIDGDTVEERNLPRQPLYGRSDTGRYKVQIACERIAHLTSRIETRNVFIDRNNCTELLKNTDLIADCSDDLHVHRLLDEHCSRNGIPLIAGAIHGRQLQVMTLHASPDRVALKHFFQGNGLSEQDGCDMTSVPVEVASMTAALMMRRIRRIIEGGSLLNAMDVMDLDHGHWLRIAPFDPDAEHELIAQNGDRS
jgi:molybdopterin/thiamine biosynthesis adenylyltransferase